MRRPFFAAVEDWLFAPVPVHAMLANRIILGGVLCAHALSRLPEFGVLYGVRSGAWSPSHREFVSAALAPDVGTLWLGALSLLSQLPAEPRQLVIGSLYAILLIASLAFALGLFTRTAGSVAVALHMLFLAIVPFGYYGWGTLLAPLTVYVLLSPAGEYLSLDAWRRARRGGGRPASARMPAWPLRLLQVHVALLYFHTGFARIDDPDWLRGEVLFEALSRALFSRFDLELLAWKPALALLSGAVFLLEPAAPLLLWIPRVRTLCALALIAMHVILELLTNVGWWNYMMIGGLLAFLPPAWLTRLLPSLDSRPPPAGRS